MFYLKCKVSIYISKDQNAKDSEKEEKKHLTERNIVDSRSLQDTLKAADDLEFKNNFTFTIHQLFTVKDITFSEAFEKMEKSIVEGIN